MTTGYTADLIRALRRLGFEYRLNQNVAGTLTQAADELTRLSAAKPGRQADVTDVRPLDLRQARRDVADVIAEELSSEGLASKAGDLCPAFDATVHEEHKGKCMYCGAPMPEVKAAGNQT
jgi:hypothetical protein